MFYDFVVPFFLVKYRCGGGCGSPGGLSVGAVSNSFAEQLHLPPRPCAVS